MKQILTGFCLLIIGLAFSFSASAQGVPAKAFKNIILHQADGSTVNDAVIVWRNGVIETAGKKKTIPFDAEVWDGGDSLHVYPGFIDGTGYWGSPDRKEFEETPSRGDPSYERAGIRPERHARETVDMKSEDFKKVMEAGFTTAALGTKGYMIPGQLDLFLLQLEMEIGDLYAEGIGMQLQFQDSYRVYPSTTMAIMAKLEQLMLEAKALKEWQGYYASSSTEIAPPENDPVLEALYPVMENEQRVFFKVDSKENIERVFQLQDELGFDWVLVSGMEAYKVADELKKRNVPVLASINFPKKPDWKKDDKDDKKDKKEKKKKAEEEEEVTEEMKAFREKRWQAYLLLYKNISELMEADVSVGFASADLELKEMSNRMNDWKEYGDIKPNEMLKVMTANTADILGKGKELGGLKKGQVASFSVMTKPFTEEETKVVYSVSAGEMNELNDLTQTEEDN